jgi:hypothetical protein
MAEHWTDGFAHWTSPEKSLEDVRKDYEIILANADVEPALRRLLEWAYSMGLEQGHDDER